MFAIIITAIYTGSKRIYPLIFESKEEAEDNINRLPYLRMFNTFEVRALIKPETKD